jgi:hypothetical protein
VDDAYEDTFDGSESYLRIDTIEAGLIWGCLALVFGRNQTDLLRCRSRL